MNLYGPPGAGGSGSGSDLPKLAETGGLSFEILDAATGQRMPGKLTLDRRQRHARSAASRRRHRHRRRRLGARASTACSRSPASASSRMPVGTYDVTVEPRPRVDDRRPSAITDHDGGSVELHAQLQHVVDTPNWVSGDFHVHAAGSTDSRVPMRDRVYEFVSDGVDMIVATDHNVVSDYKPIIEDLHAEQLPRVGDRRRDHDRQLGPLRRVPAAARRWRPRATARSRCTRRAPTDIFNDVRQTAPDAMIDVHHPRLETRDRLLLPRQVRRPERQLDAQGLLVRLRRDRDPERLPGHEPQVDRPRDAGLVRPARPRPPRHRDRQLRHAPPHVQPRRLPAELRARRRTTTRSVVTAGDVARGVKAHHAFFTTGPIVDFTIGSTGIGDLAPAPDGKATATIAVRAAPWVSVSRVMIYVAGKVEKTWDGRRERQGRSVQRDVRHHDPERHATRSFASRATARCRRSSAAAAA